MYSILERAYRLVNYLPPDLAGRIDLFRPSLRASWGGPLNGQQRRQQIVRDIAMAVRVDRVLETGSYRGTSTEFFSAVFGVPVATVEANDRFYAYSRRRLAPYPDITVELSDSRSFLRTQGSRPGADGETVFVYLDAHWERDLPLVEELEIVARSWSRCVVMIDDFQVPDDVGYTFDDYGPGKALVEAILPTAELVGWRLYYPAARSSEETGKRRGACVLTSPAIGALTEIATLRYVRSL